MSMGHDIQVRYDLQLTNVFHKKKKKNVCLLTNASRAASRFATVGEVAIAVFFITDRSWAGWLKK